MNLASWSDLLNDLRAHQATFASVIAWINQHYDYTPQAFTNGTTANAAGQNEGACRIFAFAQLKGLSEHDTLLCFAEHYRSVLATPYAHDHANIRAFMGSGWPAVHYANAALRLKS